MEIRPLRADETDACLDLWGAAFPHTGRAFFVKYFARDETWRPEDTVVCVVDGTIVSGATFVRRTVGLGDKRLTFGGVANVGTLPEARGKGYSTAVLTRLIAQMDDAGMDFSLLGTGITGFYARLGWAEWMRPYIAGVPTVAGDTPALRPATGDDLPQIRAWHAAYNAGRPIAAERSDDAWTRWLGVTPESIPSGLYIGDGGYVRVHFWDDADKGGSVREVGGEPGAIVGLLTAATKIAHERGATRFVWNAPHEPEVRAAADRWLTERCDGLNGGLMWRAHRSPLPNLAASPLAPVWWDADGF